MNLTTLAARNLTRNKTRVILTVVGVGFALVLFLFMRTVLWAWGLGGEVAAKDRLATRDRVSFIQFLPLRYAEDIKNVPGVKAVTYMNWFGGKDPKDEHNFFASMAVDHKTIFDVYPEMTLEPKEMDVWLHDKQAAILGENLARRMHVAAGDDVTLTSQIWRGEWKFHVAGVYKATAMSVDKSSFFFHWDYFNERMPPPMQSSIGWILTRIDDPSKSAAITKTIDAMFESRDRQTLTQSEKAFNTSFLGMFSAILTAVKIVSWVILAIVLLILGNTIAMGARERTYEYGVLLAIGFRPGHIGSFIVNEGVFIGLLGGLFGLALGSLVISGFGAFISQSQMAFMFPYFKLTPETALLGLALSMGFGMVAAAIPAIRSAGLSVTSALRRVG